MRILYWDFGIDIMDQLLLDHIGLVHGPGPLIIWKNTVFYVKYAPGALFECTVLQEHNLLHAPGAVFISNMILEHTVFDLEYSSR